MAAALLMASTADAAVTLTPTAVDTGYCENPYSCKITASGGTAPYTYTVSVGALPKGLTITKAGGTISGIIHLVNDTAISFTIRATDKAGQTGTRAYTMYIRNKRPTWQQNVDAWDNIGNTPPTYAQVYNTFRTSVNNSWYSSGRNIIIPYNSYLSREDAKSAFTLGTSNSQYFNLITDGAKGDSWIKGDSTNLNLRYSTTTAKTSRVLIDSAKVTITGNDSILLSSTKVKLPSIPVDSTGLPRGTIYRSGTNLKIKL